MTTNANHITVLLAVAHAAIDYHQATQEAWRAKEAYREACRQWKKAQGFDRYDRIREEDPEAFSAMKAATSEDHAKAKAAKGVEYNAKRRFLTAVRRVGS